LSLRDKTLKRASLKLCPLPLHRQSHLLLHPRRQQVSHLCLPLCLLLVLRLCLFLVLVPRLYLLLVLVPRLCLLLLPHPLPSWW